MRPDVCVRRRSSKGEEMKMNRTSAAAAVIAAGLVASLGALAPATVNADELAATAPAATQSADAEDPAAGVADDAAADADAAPSDDAVVSAVSAVALSDESAAAPEAKETAAGDVAEFNGTQYATFDEALAVAKKTNGATIKLLADAETAGLNLDKDLTIDGDGHALKFTDKGIALWGHALVLKNVNASMAGIGSTPYTAEWGWMAVSASKDASLTLDGATLTMDGAGAGNVHAIYFGSNNKLNLKNASKLTIMNYRQDALEWDGGDGGYNVNIEGGSTYTSDHCRSGFTGTFVVTVNNSKVNVVNSTGNGSNGSHFDIKNSSVVDFSGNGSHGLSAGNLTIDSSTVTAENNGLTGIIFTGKGEFKSANVRISGTKGKSYWNAGMRLMKANAKLDVDAASTVSITDNKVTGLFLDAGAKATFAKGSSLRITGNNASQENCTSKQDLAQMGGGVVVRSGASLTLTDSAVIDNNNAALAGDDIYVEKGGKIIIGKTYEDILAGFEGDCNHTIDGWYIDAAGDHRWSAHGEAKYVEAAQPGTYEAKEAPVALKAAHGLASVNYQYVGDVPEGTKAPVPDTDLELYAPYTAKTQNPVDGYTFDGWYTDEGCTAKWNDGTPLTGSMTLYGKWTKNPETPATPAETQKPTTNKPAKKQVKKSVPKTGDETSSALPFALFGGAAAVIGLGVKSRRHE